MTTDPLVRPIRIMVVVPLAGTLRGLGGARVRACGSILSLPARLQFTQLHIHRQLLAAAIDMHGNTVTGVLADENAPQGVDIVYRLVIDLHDHVAGPQTR